jgi:hypothetical protein
MVWQQGERTMITAIAPHTCIDNSIILNMAEIGVYGFAVYSAIKMHLNQTTGACFPSYARIARITGINRSTVIEYVKKLRGIKLVDPQWRFKEDGSHTSNQYNFQGAGSPAPAKKSGQAAKNQGTENSVPSKTGDDSIHIVAPEISGAVNQDTCDKGGRPEPLPLVVQDDYPGRPGRPEQSEENKKKRTIANVDLMPTMPTKKQQTCAHPVTEIVFLRDDVTVCNHCYSLLDEHFRPQEEKTAPEIVAA